MSHAAALCLGLVGHNVADQMEEILKMVDIGSGTKRQLPDTSIQQIESSRKKLPGKP